jgi:hypothetical protein
LSALIGVYEVPKVGSVELRISQVEGFLVTLRHLDGGDVRSDRTGLPTWPYERAAKDSWSVADWKRERFGPTYPGFVVDVLDGDGRDVHGHTKLETVRDSYGED